MTPLKKMFAILGRKYQGEDSPEDEIFNDLNALLQTLEMLHGDGRPNVNSSGNSTPSKVVFFGLTGAKEFMISEAISFVSSKGKDADAIYSLTCSLSNLIETNPRNGSGEIAKMIIFDWLPLWVDEDLYAQVMELAKAQRVL